MEELTVDKLRESGMVHARQLPDGRWIGVMRFLFTHGLCVDCDEYGYTGRYCYQSEGEALIAFATYTGAGDPVGDWVKYKGIDGERINPNHTEWKEGKP